MVIFYMAKNLENNYLIDIRREGEKNYKLLIKLNFKNWVLQFVLNLKIKKVLHKNKIYAIIHISSSESVSPEKWTYVIFLLKK